MPFFFSHPVALMNSLMNLIQVESFLDHLMMVIHKLLIFMLEIFHQRFGLLFFLGFWFFDLVFSCV